MAEIVGLVAASGQFLEQSIKVVSLLKKLHQNIQGAPDEIQAWCKELEHVSELITAIRTQPALQIDPLKSMTDQCQSISSELLKLLGEIDFEKTDSLGRRTWKAIGALAKESEIRDRFGQLERLKSTLSVRIAVVNLDQKSQNVASSHLSGSFQAGTPEECCLKELFVTDPISDRDGIISAKGQRTQGTCEWVLGTEEYRTWTEAHSSLLWISGPPGKGKTFISIFLNQIFEISSTKDTVISFYCSNQVPTRNTATNILRGLITQLIMKHEHLISHLISIWQHQGLNLFTSFETLWRIFDQMLCAIDSEKVYCVLDAMDECDEASLSVLLKKLVSLFARKGDDPARSNLKLVMTSRDFPECLPAMLSGFPHIRMNALDHDINLYISDRVSRLASTKGFGRSNLYDHVKEVFQQRAEGTFLWVSLMAQDLERTPSTEFEKVLRQLPHGLYAVYERILMRIGSTYQAQIMEMLTWLLYTTRPLMVDELCEALEIEPTKYLARDEICIDYIQACGHLLEFGIGNSPSFYDDITPIIKPLADEVRTEPARQSKSDKVLWVSFIHQSVRDFLSGQLPESLKLQGAILKKNNAHTMIVNRLLRYLTQDGLPCDVYGYGSSPFKLLQYATRNWPHHMRQLNSDCSVVVTDNKTFFGEQSRARTRWWNYYSHSLREKENLSLLQLACAAELYDLARYCLRKRNTFLGFRRKDQVNQQNASGESLLHILSHWTRSTDIIDEKLQIAQLLLAHGADPTLVDERGETSLHCTLGMASDDLRLFRLLESTKRGQQLIKAQAEASQVAPRDPCDLVTSAAQHGRMKLCCELIEKYGYNVDTADEYDQTLIHTVLRIEIRRAQILAKYRRTNVVKNPLGLLKAVFAYPPGCPTGSKVQKGIEFITKDLKVGINATDAEGNTVFHKAFKLDLETLQTFKENGLDLNLRNARGESILHTGPWEGSDPDQCVAAKYRLLSFILRETHLTVNSRDKFGSTPLHAKIHKLGTEEESYECSMHAVLALLDFGADRSLQEDNGMTPLDLARQYQAEISKPTEGENSDTESSSAYDPWYLIWSSIIEALLNYTTVPVDAEAVPYPQTCMELCRWYCSGRKSLGPNS